MANNYHTSVSSDNNNLKNYIDNLGNNLRTLRQTKSITQREAAKACNISWRTISNIERGKVIPNLRIIFSLSDLFNVSISSLFTSDPLNSKSSQ